jgi:hypothetical protein
VRARGLARTRRVRNTDYLVKLLLNSTRSTRPQVLLVFRFYGCHRCQVGGPAVGDAACCGVVVTDAVCLS